MELTARIISKVFLLDGRQVLFHVSVNTFEALGENPRKKKKEYMFEAQNEVTKETSPREEKSASWGRTGAGGEKELTFPRLHHSRTSS